MNVKTPGTYFILFALVALMAGVLMGSLSGLQFIIPGFFDLLPFFKSRPLHVSLVVSWLFLTSIGGIYYYLPKYCDCRIYSPRLVSLHLWIFILTGLAILISYVAGKFGGREYWEFPPILSLPIILSWIIFAFNFFKSTSVKKRRWPAYWWMWGTGIFFFLFTFIEANSWVFSWISNNAVREITIQWKAYGSLVGSWNMLIYGTALFLLEKISGDSRISFSKTAFFLYFLGLSNLMFGWAHHTYLVPSASWIRHFAYFISMTELIVLGRIIWNWKSTLAESKKHQHHVSYTFIIASDIWIFLNLVLAILISIPAINIYTHGTHITVAHAMGSTIGINTMILLASVFFILQENSDKRLNTRMLNSANWLTNISLLVFWISLILAGYTKGVLTMENEVSFQEIMLQIRPYLIAFTIAGLGLFLGIIIITWTALRRFSILTRTK